MTRECRENRPPETFSRLGRMPRLAASLLVMTLGSAAALFLVACGEEDAQLLPGETAREITANLDAVKQLADEGDCTGAESAARQVSEQVETLAGVDPKLKRALEEGAARLREVIAGCEEAASEAIDPATIPPEFEAEDERQPQDEEGENGDGGEGDEGRSGDDEEGSPSPPPLPPQAEGEAKGRPPSETEPPEESEEGGEEAPSGGVSPGAPVEGDDD